MQKKRNKFRSVMQYNQWWSISHKSCSIYMWVKRGRLRPWHTGRETENLVKQTWVQSDVGVEVTALHVVLQVCVLLGYLWCLVCCDVWFSERADAAGTTGQRLKEGGSINKSLVTLGNVISTLGRINLSVLEYSSLFFDMYAGFSK